jgi:hypothetical protein
LGWPIGVRYPGAYMNMSFLLQDTVLQWKIVNNINGTMKQIHITQKWNTQIHGHILHKPPKHLQIPCASERVKLAVVLGASMEWHSTARRMCNSL